MRQQIKRAQDSYGLLTVNGCANNGRGSSGYGGEGNGFSWATDTSVAAQWSGQAQTNPYKNKNKDIRKAIEDADAILSGDNDCSKFFGEYAKQALLALDDLLRKDPVENNNQYIGIRQNTTEENPKPIDFRGRSKIVGDKVIQESAYRVFPEGTVNSNGPFFNFRSPAKIGYSTKTGFQGYEPISRRSRVTQILHELAHMIYKSDGKGGYEPLIADDVGSGATDNQSSVNTETILANCKTEIDKLKEGGKRK